MQEYLLLEDEEKYVLTYWYIQVEGNTQTIREGLINQPGVVQTITFDSEDEAIKDAEKQIEEKLEKGYWEESRPFLNDLMLEGNEDYEHQMTILVDLEDKEKVIEIIDRVFEYQEFCVEADTECRYYINYVVKNLDDVKEPYKHISFFYEAMKRYPELEEKIAAIETCVKDSSDTRHWNKLVRQGGATATQKVD